MKRQASMNKSQLQDLIDSANDPQADQTQHKHSQPHHGLQNSRAKIQRKPSRIINLVDNDESKPIDLENLTQNAEDSFMGKMMMSDQAIWENGLWIVALLLPFFGYNAYDDGGLMSLTSFKLYEQEEAYNLFEELRAKVHWEHKLSHKTWQNHWGRTPRAQAAFYRHAPKYDVKYNHERARPSEIPPYIEKILKKIKEKVGIDYNYVLINRYYDGDDYISKHRDNEGGWKDPHNEPLLTLALCERGTTNPRRITISDRHGNWKKEFEHTNGWVMRLNGSTNINCYHEVQQATGFKHERISVTLRSLNKGQEPSIY